MPAVCRFYLKGYCRYGQNCRFEHPGENSLSSQEQPLTNFSFKTALSNIGFSQLAQPEPPSATGFSFTRALQATSNVDDVDMSEGLLLDTSRYSNPLGSIFGSPANSTQQQQSSFSGFASQTQSISTFNQPQQVNQTSLFHTVNYSQPTDLSSTAITNRNTSSSQKDKENLIFSELQSLDQKELKAFENNKFEFRNIPVRPPPKCLCW